ncbi:MAG TPA: site-specific integrase [Gaiellaceae bacterium]|nr:site-specific integrase [Gaiellaceae bacterium]
MPSTQRGSVTKRGTRWLVRYYDETGDRKARGGFETRSAALEWLDGTLDGVNALRRGERPAAADIPTVAVLVERFLATHEVDQATTDKLRYELKHATRAFGEQRIDQLRPMDLDAWRGTLPARSRHQLFRSFRQVLEQAVTWGLLERNPTDRIRNRRAKLDEDREIRPFETWEEVEAISAELTPIHQALPIFLVGTGMRPEEALALEWKDIDKTNAVASIERVHSQGRTKPCMKSDRQRRRVPLRAKVLEALEQHPRRLDSRLVFPAKDGDYLKQQTFRLRHWTPALRAAGVDHRSVYTCRHTFASWGIRAGLQLFYLSRIMGTSVTQIDATYGHLVPDSEEYLRGLLDTYDEAYGHRLGTGTT